MINTREPTQCTRSFKSQFKSLKRSKLSDEILATAGLPRGRLAIDPKASAAPVRGLLRGRLSLLRARVHASRKSAYHILFDEAVQGEGAECPRDRP